MDVKCVIWINLIRGILLVLLFVDIIKVLLKVGLLLFGGLVV